MRGTAIGAALLLGLGGVADAQERQANEPSGAGGSWLSRLWPFGRRAEAPKKNASPDARRASESAQGVRDSELAAWQRRSAVCLRLQEIALQTGDIDLERRADDLSRMAWDTYLLRTAHLPGAGADEDTLGRRLPAGEGELLLERGAGRPGGGVASRRE